MSDTVKIGKKGEIIPPIKLRRELGLDPGKRISIDVIDGKLVMELVPTPLQQLRKKKLVKVTIDELNSNSAEIQEEWLSTDD